MKYTTSDMLTEAELEYRVAAHMARRGYEVLTNFRIRTWRPDIVARMGDEVIVVEVKGYRGDVRKAIAQAGVFATDATYSLLAVPPAQTSEWLRNAADALGVGLWTVSDKVRQIVPPKKGTARPSFLARVQRATGGASKRKPRAASRRRPTMDRILRHARVLDLFLRYPGREFTIREVAIESDTSYSTTWRVVRDLSSLGVLASKRIGPSNVVSLNRRSPVLADLRRLRSLELSPHRHAARRLADRLAQVPQVRSAILFGSASRGLEETASDVDVAVVVDPPMEAVRAKVHRLAEKVQDETGLPLMPTLLHPADLKSRGQLARDVRGGEVLYERD